MIRNDVQNPTNGVKLKSNAMVSLSQCMQVYTHHPPEKQPLNEMHGQVKQRGIVLEKSIETKTNADDMLCRQSNTIYSLSDDAGWTPVQSSRFLSWCRRGRNLSR